MCIWLQNKRAISCVEYYLLWRGSVEENVRLYSDSCKGRTCQHNGLFYSQFDLFSCFLFLQIGCAWPSTIEAAEDQCAVLYQLITPSIACDLSSRGLQPHFNRRLYSEWWSNSPLVTPNRLSHFIFKIKQGLVQNFSVYFMVRRIIIWLHAKVCSVAGVAIT